MSDLESDDHNDGLVGEDSDIVSDDENDVLSDDQSSDLSDDFDVVVRDDDDNMGALLSYFHYEPEPIVVDAKEACQEFVRKFESKCASLSLLRTSSCVSPVDTEKSIRLSTRAIFQPPHSMPTRRSAYSPFTCTTTMQRTQTTSCRRF